MDQKPKGLSKRPLTLAQTRIVDWLGIEKGTGHVVLTIADEADWTDSDSHLKLLEAKLNTYIACIESGEVFEQVSKVLSRSVSKQTPIKISVLAQFHLSSEGRMFMDYARSTLAAIGVQLEWKLIVAPS